MDANEIEQKLESLYKELDIFEAPWRSLVDTYMNLQSDETTRDSDYAKMYHNHIINVQDEMKKIRDRIHQLENLYPKEENNILQNTSDTSLHTDFSENNDIDQPLSR